MTNINLADGDIVLAISVLIEHECRKLDYGNRFKSHEECPYHEICHSVNRLEDALDAMERGASHEKC